MRRAGQAAVPGPIRCWSRWRRPRWQPGPCGGLVITPSPPSLLRHLLAVACTARFFPVRGTGFSPPLKDKSSDKYFAGFQAGEAGEQKPGPPRAAPPTPTGTLSQRRLLPPSPPPSLDLLWAPWILSNLLHGDGSSRKPCGYFPPWNWGVCQRLGAKEIEEVQDLAAHPKFGGNCGTCETRGKRTFIFTIHILESRRTKLLHVCVSF